MKRLLLVLSLAAIIAASGLPAVAQGWDPATGCREGDQLVGVAFGDPVDKNQDLAACSASDGSRYDNRLEREPQSGGGWDPATGCREGDQLVGVASGDPIDENQDLVVCRASDGSRYDNRLKSTR